MRGRVVGWLSAFIGHDAAVLLVPGWFACIAAAWLVVSVMTLRAAARRDDDVPALAAALAAVYAAAIAGGIGLPAIASAAGGLWSGQGLRLRWSGMVSYAGFACGAVALAVVLRRNQTLRPARAADLLAAPLGVGLCVGRLGCFLAGCDYGQVSSLPWAVRFPAGSAAWRDHVRAGWISSERGESLPVHPTQLYESLLGLVLCAAALLAARTDWARRGRGRVFVVVAGGYAVGRMAIENLRGDVGRGVFGPWSSAQLVCTILLIGLVATIWRGRRRIVASAAGAAIAVCTIAGAAHAEEPAPPPAARPASAPAPAATSAPDSDARSGATPPGAASRGAPPGGPSVAPGVPSVAPGGSSVAPGGSSVAPGGPSVAPGGPSVAPPGSPPGVAPPLVTVQPRAAATAGEGPAYRVGGYLAGASALNRRERQVPPLAGVSLTGGIRFGPLGVEVDLMSAASEVAAHQSIVFVLALGGPIGQRLFATMRFGLGYNVVDFEDRAFEDVGSGDLRIGGEVGFALSHHWSAVLRPLELDLIGARELGGPIWTYQLQLGVSYRFGPAPPPDFRPR